MPLEPTIDLPVTLWPEQATRISNVVGSLVILGAGLVGIWASLAIGLIRNGGWLILLPSLIAAAYGIIAAIRAPRMGVTLTSDDITVRGLFSTTSIPRRQIQTVTDAPSVAWVDGSGEHRATPLTAFNLKNTNPNNRFVAATNAKVAIIKAWAAEGEGEITGPTLPEGENLKGLTANAWVNIELALFAGFLFCIASLYFTAPAFHPDENTTDHALGTTWCFVTFGTVLVLFLTTPLFVIRKSRKEQERGYTTIRWADPDKMQIRDRHGRVIPAGDRRLKGSRQLFSLLGVMGPVFIILSVGFFLIRTILMP